MSKTFSITYYAIVVIGGGMVIAIYSALASRGDTYGGLVLGLIIILLGCMLPLFAAPRNEEQSGGTGPTEESTSDAVEVISNNALEQRNPLDEGWDLPL